MSEIAVPIPPGSVPAGAPLWLSADAGQWVRARPAVWARPLWSVLALVAAVVWAVAVEPVPVCSEAAPCGPDWTGMMQVGLAAGLVYWLARLPELALIAAPALAVAVVLVELPDAGLVVRAANVAVVAALVFGWTASRERLAARRRQRELAERAARARHLLPEALGPLRRGIPPIAAGLILCAVAAGAMVQGFRAIHADEQHAARAKPTAAEVVSRQEESLRLRTDDARRLTVGTPYPEDYRVGSTVTVLEDGSWQRLAAEPYDALGWQLLLLAAGLPGISLLTAGAVARRRAAVLRGAPVPVLRVLERVDTEGRTWLYAADDTSASTPLGTCFVTPAVHEASDHEAPDDETRDDPDTRTREAVLFGAPYDGGELALLTTDENAHPVVHRTVGPIRPPRIRTGLFPEPPVMDVTGASPEQRRPTDRVAATLTATERCRNWGPGPRSRAAGLALAAVMAVACGTFARTLAREGFAWETVLMPAVLGWIGPTATVLNWRVTADNAGLWLTGAWKTRHVPWERLRAVRRDQEGTARITMDDGSTWTLTGTGAPGIERRLRLRPSHVRMVEEVAALHAHPDLRPREASTRREHGLPLGPALLVLVVLAAAVACFV
ncbi:hypothetical protein [Streptomyces sp. NPDC047725]|uniref:hypothetical protein n=1 Tax=Streptomyces sp. NPDC047725 TaxID=3365487 RepID=UPI003718494A